MDISIIDELPKNRASIKTKVVSEDEICNVYELMKKEMKAGHQCFIVYPIIEESEKLDLKAAVTAYDNLKNEIFKDFRIGYIDGRIKKEERDIQMNKFLNNEINCIVSTTVIEVGIDVPNATVMLIENADRFGLSQLHQLRGRIGRGNKSSYCFLAKSKEDSTERLKILEKTSNGFNISDEDLKLRGPGEFFGTKQHGYLKSGLSDFYNDGPIIRNARSLAFKLIEEDPQLNKMEHEQINRILNYDYKSMLELINIG